MTTSRTFSRTLALLLAGLGTACATQTSPKPAVSAVPPVSPTVVVSAAPAPLPPVPERRTPDAPFRQQAPGAGAEPTFSPPHWKRFKLKNGLDVFLVEFHDLPLIDFNLMVKTGGAANPADKAGLADLTARMLDEGTKTRGAIEIADQVAALGATLSTGGSWDASSVNLSTLSRNLDPALDIFADVVQHPAFDDKEFTRVRDNLLTAITRRKDSPPTVAGLALSHLLYGAKHPYAWPMTGTEASIKKLTPADLRAFYDAYYRPERATLVVTGDIAPDAIYRFIAARPNQPGTRIFRYPLRRPLFHRGDERFLPSLFGRVEIAEQTDQSRENTTRLSAKDCFDFLIATARVHIRWSRASDRT